MSVGVPESDRVPAQVYRSHIILALARETSEVWLLGRVFRKLVRTGDLAAAQRCLVAMDDRCGRIGKLRGSLPRRWLMLAQEGAERAEAG